MDNTASLAGILGLCAALYAGQSWLADEPAQPGTTAATTGDPPKEPASQTAQPPKQTASFLAVYALVMAADWLQAPFLAALYTTEHGVAARHVPLLVASGYAASAVSALFVGSAADRHGRKLACLVFCAASAASCVLAVAASGSLAVLLLGRILGGVSTSLLFSVFESWMVTDFWEREKYGAVPAVSGLSGLSDVSELPDGKYYTQEMTDAASDRLALAFGRMGTVNSLAAIASGVFGDWAVGASGSCKAPLIASAVLLGAASWLISTQWDENYGDPDETDDGGGALSVLCDPRVLVLGLASTLFEGCLYLFVCFWAPALQDFASPAASSPAQLPRGAVSASFMASALAATLAFGIAAAQLRLARCVTLLLGLLGAAEVVFILLSSPTALASLAQQHVFWLFCLFGACAGAYGPCMGCLRGRVVPDSARAQVYALLRAPPSILVAAAALLTRDSAYAEVFGTCSTLLLGAIAGVIAMMMNEPNLP